MSVIGLLLLVMLSLQRQTRFLCYFGFQLTLPSLSYKRYYFSLIAGLIICPSRELAKQTFDIVEYYSATLLSAGFRPIRSALCMGGMPVSACLEVLGKGVHIIVATPGRLMDMLDKKMLRLDICRFVH